MPEPVEASTGHGGRREGAGRKPFADPGRRRRSVTVWLSHDEEAYLDRIGDGNVSAAVRELIRLHRERL